MELHNYDEYIIATALEMIILFDEKGKILATNKRAEAELGYQENELLGVSIERVLTGLLHRAEDGTLIDVECGEDSFEGSI